jgi:predicted phosphodiesterase
VTKDGKGIILCNPGSISLPKSGVQPKGQLAEGESPKRIYAPRTYAVYSSGEIAIQDLDAEDPECSIFHLHIPEVPRCKG